MIYVFDSSSLIDLFRHYYLERFPTLWEKFDDLVQNDTIVSVREVKNEIGDGGDRLSDWTKAHRELFAAPSNDEMAFVAGIFKITAFQMLIKKRDQFKGKPVADPFVIARANAVDGCVVTEEKQREKAVRIPDVCQHFDIQCMNLEGFMQQEKWSF